MGGSRSNMRMNKNLDKQANNATAAVAAFVGRKACWFASNNRKEK